MVESWAVGAVVAANAGGAFRLVKGVGQLRDSDLDEAGMLKVPFCLVRYDGASGVLGGGGVTDATARLQVLVGSLGNCAGLEGRYADIKALLKLVQDALMGKHVSGSVEGAVWTGEAGVAVDEESGVEVWEQNYEIGFRLG
jgi:hypothetical protein